MSASYLAVLWHRIVLSQPVWFLVEVVAKKPWKWSVYSVFALTSFFPLIMIAGFALLSVVFGLMALATIQCGIVTFSFASSVSSAVMIAPVALFLTLFIYVMYKFTVLVIHSVRWLLSIPSRIMRYIQQELNGTLSHATRNLCCWRNVKKTPRKDVSSVVRSRAEKRLTRRNSRLLSDSETERKTKQLGETQQQPGLLACLEMLKQTLTEESVTEDSYSCDSHLQASCCSRKKPKRWLNWLNHSDSDSSISDGDCSAEPCCLGFEFQRSSSRTNSALQRRARVGRGSASSLSSDDETIRFASGSGSDSYYTADEWLAEDYTGNVIPDYRDRESKLYDALLKRDFCHHSDSYMYY